MIMSFYITTLRARQIFHAYSLKAFNRSYGYACAFCLVGQKSKIVKISSEGVLWTNHPGMTEPIIELHHANIYQGSNLILQDVNLG